MASLKEILNQVKKETTGTVVTETGAVDIAPSVAGEPVDIKSSDGTVTLSIADNGEISFGDGQVIRKVVSLINDTDPNNSTNLSNVAAIVERINSAVSGTLTFDKIDSKAEFDTFLAQNVIVPSTVLVTDPAIFDYTDTNGKENIGIDYWLGIVTKPTAVVALSTTTQSTSKSTNTQSGAEIKIALFAETDTNNLNDIRAAIVDSIVSTVETGLGTKVDKVAGQGLSTNNYDNASKSKVDNVPANTTDELSNKVPIDARHVNITITNTGTGNGTISLVNSAAPVDQKTFTITPRSSGQLDIDAKNEAGGVQFKWVFNHGGVTNFPGQITQSGNNVLDVTDSKYSNLPNNTAQELSGKLNSGSTTAAINDSVNRRYVTDSEKSALNNVPADINSDLASKLNLSGGTLTGNVTIAGNKTIKTDDGMIIDRKAHIDQGDREFIFGTLVVTSPTGMKIIESYNGTYNLQSIEFFTHLGGINAGSRMTIDPIGDVTFQKNINVLGNISRNGVNVLYGDGSTTTAAFPDSLNRRYVTDSEKSAINNVPSNVTNSLSGKYDKSGGLINGLVLATGNVSGANLLAHDEGFVEFLNTTSAANNRRSRIGHGSDEGLIIEALSDSGGIQNRWTLRNNGTTLIPGDLEANGDVTAADVIIDDYKVVRNRARQYVGTGAGANTTLVDFVATWMGERVQFFSTGVISTKLPEIVLSNANSAQVLIGQSFYVDNYNSAASITLTTIAGQTQWVSQNVGVVVEGNIDLLFNSSFVVTALDARNFSTVTGNVCWAVMQITST